MIRVSLSGNTYLTVSVYKRDAPLGPSYDGVSSPRSDAVVGVDDPLVEGLSLLPSARTESAADSKPYPEKDLCFGVCIVDVGLCAGPGPGVMEVRIGGNIGPLRVVADWGGGGDDFAFSSG
jgi:hypothetical protein